MGLEWGYVVAIYYKGLPLVVVFEILLSYNVIITTRSYPRTMCDVAALALLNPKTSRFVGLTLYRCRVRFRWPLLYYIVIFYKGIKELFNFQ